MKRSFQTLYQEVIPIYLDYSWAKKKGGNLPNSNDLQSYYTPDSYIW